MSTLSYLNYDDIGAFEGLYQQYQQALESVDKEWCNFIEGFEFSKADFSQVNKKKGCVISLLNSISKPYFAMLQ